MGNMMLKNLGTGLVLGCPILQTVYSVINPLVNVYIYIYSYSYEESLCLMGKLGKPSISMGHFP